MPEVSKTVLETQIYWEDKPLEIEILTKYTGYNLPQLPFLQIKCTARHANTPEYKYFIEFVFEFHTKFNELKFYFFTSDLFFRKVIENENIPSQIFCKICLWMAWNVPEIRENREEILIIATIYDDDRRMYYYYNRLFSKLGFNYDLYSDSIPDTYSPEIRLTDVLQRCILGKKETSPPKKKLKVTKYEIASMGLEATRARRAQELANQMSKRLAQVRSKRNDPEVYDLADIFSKTRL